MNEVRGVGRWVVVVVTGTLAALVGAGCSGVVDPAAPAAPSENVGERSSALTADPIFPPSANLCSPSNYFATSKEGFASCDPNAPTCDAPTKFQQYLAANGCVLGQIRGQIAIIQWTAPDGTKDVHNWMVANCPRFPLPPNTSYFVPTGADGFTQWAPPALDPDGLVDQYKKIDPVDSYRREYCGPASKPERMVIAFDPVCPTCLHM
jgi:hypothetical protein